MKGEVNSSLFQVQGRLLSSSMYKYTDYTRQNWTVHQMDRFLLAKFMCRGGGGGRGLSKRIEKIEKMDKMIFETHE